MTRQVPRASIFASGKPKALVNWLKRVQPSKLRCETEDGEKLVAVSAKGGLKQASITAKAVLALGALKVEAIDPEGDTLDVFQLVDPEADPSETAYARSEDDSPDERVLKTFGQLLAAAHHSAAKQLVDTVQLMSTHYAQERQAMRGQAEALERLNRRLAARVRVATDDPDDEDAPAAEGNFVEEFISGMVKAKMAKGMSEAMGGGGAAPANGAANGAGSKD